MLTLKLCAPVAYDKVLSFLQLQKGRHPRRGNLIGDVTMLDGINTATTEAASMLATVRSWSQLLQPRPIPSS